MVGGFLSIVIWKWLEKDNENFVLDTYISGLYISEIKEFQQVLYAGQNSKLSDIVLQNLTFIGWLIN